MHISNHLKTLLVSLGTQECQKRHLKSTLTRNNVKRQDNKLKNALSSRIQKTYCEPFVWHSGQTKMLRQTNRAQICRDNLHSNGVIVESNRQTPKLQIKQQQLKKTEHQMTSIRANQIISFTRLISQMWLFLEIIYRVPAYNHRFGTMLNMSIFNHHFWGRKIWAIYKRMKCALLLKGFKISTSWDGLGWIKHVKTLVNYVERIWLYTSNISWS